jgi:hypothetical protein
MDNRVIQYIASQENALAVLIWFFMQLYVHWINPENGSIDDSFYPPISLQTAIVDRLLSMLSAIECGQLTVTPMCNPEETITEVPYTVSNGWIVTIYSRVYQWHRIDRFTTPDGIEFDPWLLPEEALHDRLFDYDPSPDIQQKIYRFKSVS